MKRSERLLNRLVLLCCIGALSGKLFAAPADYDNDGIPNQVENDIVGLNPNDASDALTDLDGDGWSNLDEYRFGTEILDSNNHPAMLSGAKHQKVFADDASASDYFGGDVAIYGDTAIIGARGASYPGSAYVYVRNSGGLWTQQAKLTPSDATVGKNFGRQVAIHEDTVVVGAQRDEINGTVSGSAYVYTRIGEVWSEQAKLVPADGETNDFFGISVSVSGDTAIIGAYRDDEKGIYSGSAYVFTRNGEIWSQQAKITANDGAPDDFFGIRVLVSGDTALISSLSNVHGYYSGAVYVFTRSGNSWSEQTKLSPAMGAAEQFFGISLAMSGDTVLIGARGDNSQGSFSGSAYVFQRSGGLWSQQAKLIASDGAKNHEFGLSVALVGDAAFIAAPLDDSYDTETGRIYVFTRSLNQWSERGKIAAADSEPSDRFGNSLAVSGSLLLAGAVDDADSGVGSGSAYFFDLSNYLVDTDADGLLDSDDADKDGDGIPNLVEVELGLDELNNADGSSDLDGDGWSNSDEYLFGTDISDLFSNPSVYSGNLHQKVFASNGTAGKRFGYSVAISDDTALLATNNSDVVGIGSDVVYVYTFSDGKWREQAKLRAKDSVVGDRFGTSLALSQDTALVGAFYDATNGTGSGCVYVFTRDGNQWSEEAKIIGSDTEALDYFGYSVALSDDTAIIGASGDDDQGSASGSAYIFTRTGTSWNQIDKLTAADGTANAQFGGSVSLDSDTVIIGAKRGDDNGINSGSAYVFHRDGDTWNQQAKLLADDRSAGDEFGVSVAVSGDTALIGSYKADYGGTDSGAAYVFVRDGDTWLQQAKLIPENPEDYGFFGWDVDLAGDIAIVGAYLDKQEGYATGAAYVFGHDTSGWNRLAKVTARDLNTKPNIYFGFSVALFEEIVLVGAINDDDSGNKSGSAYFIDFSSYIDSDNDGLFDDLENQLGTDPLVSDTDNDGLSDWEEQNQDSDPLNPDTDGDGVMDGLDNTPLVPNDLEQVAADMAVASYYARDTDGDGVFDVLANGRFVNPGPENQRIAFMEYVLPDSEDRELYSIVLKLNITTNNTHHETSPWNDHLREFKISIFRADGISDLYDVNEQIWYETTTVSYQVSAENGKSFLIDLTEVVEANMSAFSNSLLLGVSIAGLRTNDGGWGPSYIYGPGEDGLPELEVATVPIRAAVPSQQVPVPLVALVLIVFGVGYMGISVLQTMKTKESGYEI